MKNLIRRIKTYLPDEMDKSIRLKSIQWTWLYSIIFLLAWVSWEVYNARKFNTPMNSIPTLLLSSQVLILSVSQLIYCARFLKCNDDEQKANNKKRIIIGIVIALIFVAIAAIFTYGMIRQTA